MINILRHFTKTVRVLSRYIFTTQTADLKDSRQSGHSGEGLLIDSNFVHGIS